MATLKPENGPNHGWLEFAPATKPRQHWGCAGQKKSQSTSGLKIVVEMRRIELLTFALRTRRSPS